MHEYLFDEIKELSDNFTKQIIKSYELDFIISESQVMKDITKEVENITNDNNEIEAIVFGWLWTDCANILINYDYTQAYDSGRDMNYFYKIIEEDES